MKLCARFYDPQKGCIFFNGVPMNEINPESLMSHISMVFQDVYLFQDTIRNNIRFGKTDATDEEIIAVAKKACCHDFIMRLPQGYDTMVGEGGCTLSGGEKQRISIARAMLKDAPVILLDEATASLDPENEVEVQKAIDSLIKGRTVIAIAHRLKTIKDADRIIVLDNGRIQEEGTHDGCPRRGRRLSERSKEISMRASGLSAQFISEHRGARRETPLFFQLPSGQGGTRREQRNPVAQHHGEYAQLHFVNQGYSVNVLQK